MELQTNKQFSSSQDKKKDVSEGTHELAYSIDLPHLMLFGLCTGQYVTQGEDYYYYFERSKLCSSVSILYTLFFGLLCLSDGILFNISCKIQV